MIGFNNTQYLLSASHDCKIRVWTLEAGELKPLQEQVLESRIFSLAVVQEKLWIIAALENGGVAIWDI